MARAKGLRHRTSRAASIPTQSPVSARSATTAAAARDGARADVRWLRDRHRARVGLRDRAVTLGAAAPSRQVTEADWDACPRRADRDASAALIQIPSINPPAPDAPDGEMRVARYLATQLEAAGLGPRSSSPCRVVARSTPGCAAMEQVGRPCCCSRISTWSLHRPIAGATIRSAETSWMAGSTGAGRST